MRLQEGRILLRVVVHSLILIPAFLGMAVGMLAGDDDVSGPFGLLLFIYIAVMRANPWPQILERRLIQSARCPFCSQVFDLVNIWSCGCGYVDWQPRHALSSCRSCGRAFSWLECPRCKGSIDT